MKATSKRTASPPEQLRARRLVISQIIAEGGCPRPEQFRRAGLPPLIRASDLAVCADVVEAVQDSTAGRKRRRLPGPAF